MRQLRQLLINGTTTLDELSRAAYYQNSYILLAVTPRGVWSATQVTAEKFKEDGMLPASREVWRMTWQAVRQVEQQHEWISEHPQGTEFDEPILQPDPRLAITTQHPPAGLHGTCAVCGGPAFTALLDPQGQTTLYCFRDLPEGRQP